jgi:hypothetical protein
MACGRTPAPPLSLLTATSASPRPGVASSDVGIGKDGKRKDNFSRGMEILAKQTLFAEGARGSCSEDLMERFKLRAGVDPQVRRGLTCSRSVSPACAQRLLAGVWLNRHAPRFTTAALTHATSADLRHRAEGGVAAAGRPRAPGLGAAHLRLAATARCVRR